MDDSLIRLSCSSISIEEILNVTEVLDQGYLGHGETTVAFENAVSNFLGVNTLAVNSGTTALLLALQAAGVVKGSIVIVPSLTYVATIQAISALGGVPYFVDVNEFGQIDLQRINASTLKSAVAVIPVHFGGPEINLEYLFKLSDMYGFRVVEDAAHSFGSQNIVPNLQRRRYDFVCYSFDGIKNITTAEGGAVCANFENDRQFISDARFLGVIKDTESRNKNERTWLPQVQRQGWRAHLSNLNAAIGLAQLNRKSELWSARKSILKRYHDSLSPFNSIIKPIISSDHSVVPHIYPVLLPVPLRKKLEQKFKAANIQYGRHYFPNHLLSFYKDCPRDSLKITEHIYDRIISLPMHPLLSEYQVDRVIDIVLSIF